MRVPLLNLEISRAVAREKALSPVSENRGGWFRIFESFPTAWQRNVEIDFNSVLSFHAVYACVTLIASDIAKLRVKLVTQDQASRVWTETRNAAYDPVLRKPNAFQTRIQFWENWMLSKLLRGNTYVLKERNDRGGAGAGNVRRLYVLDPQRVLPMVSDDGSVFYRLQVDNIAGIRNDILVPASEIIHDRFNCLFHPLVGVSPIYAAGLAATQGLNIQTNSTQFFGNRSMPGGILTGVNHIDQEKADELKRRWDENYGGDNRGKVAVLGGGLEFKEIMMSSHDAQLIEQLKWSAEVVCSTFHVPPYKIGVGQMPTYNNVQALNVEYYSQALQRLIEDAELCLDEGLEMTNGAGIAEGIGTEFDVDNLLRMDSVTQMDVIDKGKNTLTPDEARRRLDLPPVEGGNAVYRQQQDFSLAALAKRDAKEDPFSKGDTSSSTAPADGANSNAADGQQRNIAEEILKRARWHDRRAA